MVERVLLADDDETFRTQLEQVIARVLPDAQIVASVPDGHAAVAAALAHSPTVVLIDYGMPGPDGAHAGAVISQALPGARVVILTGRDPVELADVSDNMPVARKGPQLEQALTDALG